MRSLLLFLMLLAVSAAHAQCIDSLFAATPREVLSVIDRSGRLDLLDLYNSGLTARVENVYGGQTEMTAKDSTSLTLKTTASGTWKMVVVPTATDTLLLTFYTLRAGGESTQVRFYDAHWRAVRKTIAVPSFADFWCPTVGLDPNMENVYRETAAQAPVRIDWDAADKSLVYTVSLDAVAEDYRQAVEKCLCPVKQPLFPKKQ